MRPLKLILGILMLPLCVAVTLTLGDCLMGIGSLLSEPTRQLLYWFVGGFLFWVLLFFTLPQPFLSYVVAHEVTHALWALLYGARVSNLKVSRKGGSVAVSHSNVWITLAPYFFPFYLFLVIITYLVLLLFMDLSTYTPFFSGLAGLAWAYHLTFTIKILRTRQPDVLEHGRIFSYTLIYILNIAEIAVVIALLFETPLLELYANFHEHALRCYGYLNQQFASISK